MLPGLWVLLVLPQRVRQVLVKSVNKLSGELVFVEKSW